MRVSRARHGLTNICRKDYPTVIVGDFNAMLEATEKNSGKLR